MLGVADWKPHPPALKTLITLLKQRLLTLSVSQDIPKIRPQTFITIDRVGGTEGSSGLYSLPLFAINCYALDAGGAEELSERVLAELKSLQFREVGDVQVRAFNLVGGPHHYPDPDITDRRRWQMTVEMGFSNRRR